MEVGDGAIPLALSGTPTKKGPITVKLHVEISSVATPYDLTAESRAKLAGEVTVTMFKLLPRLAVLDWGDYEKGTGTNFNNGTPRSFSFGLALEEEGDNLRNYTSKTTDWLPSASMFFAHNRFAFANLKPGTTYWFWIIAHELGPKKEDSDKTWFSFTTPEENLAPNVILYKDFDDFWFRGCPIYQAFGPEVSNAQIGANIDPDDPNCVAASSKILNPCNTTDSFFNYASSATDNRGPVKAAKLWASWWEGDTYGTDYADADYPGWQGLLGPLPDRSRTALDRIRLGLHQDPQTGRHRRRDGRHHRHVPHGALLRAVPLVGTGPRTTLHPGRRSRNHHRRRPDQDRTDRGSHGQYGQAGDRAVHDACGQQQSPHNRLRKSHGARDQDHRSHQGDPHRDRRPPVRDQTLPAVDRRHQGNERLTTANNL